MKQFIWFLSLFLLLIIQTGVLAPVHLEGVNLILILIIVSALLADFNLGLGLTLIGGLFLDFVSGLPDGIITMSFLCVFLLLYFIVNSVLAREPSQIILFTSVASATVAYFIIFLLFNQVFSLIHLTTDLGYKYILTMQLPLSVAFNLIFTYPIYQYYLSIEKLTSQFIKNEQPIRNK